MTTRRLLRGGLIADGIGSKTQLGDVLIDDDTIIAVGSRVGNGVDAEIIDLTPGSVVCPGFIDAHVHAERQLALDGFLPGALAQGVTTLVVGQDGSSWIGGSAATVAYLSDYFGPVNGTAPVECGCSLAEYSRLVTGFLGQNVAVLASQGTIRHGLAGSTDRPLSAAEIKSARLAVERALGEGAVGLSSGLDYIPQPLRGRRGNRRHGRTTRPIRPPVRLALARLRSRCRSWPVRTRQGRSHRRCLCARQPPVGSARGHRHGPV